jgi:hypothetical protein
MLESCYGDFVLCTVMYSLTSENRDFVVVRSALNRWHQQSLSYESSDWRKFLYIYLFLTFTLKLGIIDFIWCKYL